MPSTLTYSVPNSWTGGFIGNMALNGGEAGLDGWTIAFDAGFAITNIWGAEIVSHVGTHYVLRNLEWNAKVPAGGGISFGFQGSGDGAATALTLNGVAQGGTVPEAPPVPPVIRVGGGEAAEADGALAFTVSLDKPASGPVTVAYATADGTALAGSDYVAAQGSVVFSAGETSKTVRITLLDDATHEGAESFSLLLANPSGATLAPGGLAIGSIRDDDPLPAPLPVLSVADAAGPEGSPDDGAAYGFFSTRGNQIVDSAGQPVRIAGVNWFGLESGNLAPHGLWARGYKEMMEQMKEEGFNTIRLPFSSELLHTAQRLNGIDFSKNPDLAGLSGLQVMDKIIDYAGEIGLRVILDHHRGSAGAGTSGNGLWYGEGYTEAQWIADWTMLAGRYAGNATVIGADLHNEPYNGSWGGGGANDWAAAAERAGNAVLSANPDWLIFVEGVGTYQGEGYWWGGNLMGVRDRPVQLDLPGKLVYSAHDYPNSIYGQSWFSGPGWENELTAKFDEMWGYIYREGIAPVYLGEFGSKLADPKDLVWLEKITAYLAGDLDADGMRDIPAGDHGVSWTWWSWNPNSGDTGGILADDWATVITAKTAWLDPLMDDLGAPAEGAAAGARSLHFAVTLSAAAAQDVWVDYATMPGTADSADFTPITGTLHFAPGETAKTVAVVLTADNRVEGDEQFTLQLSNPRGATGGQLTGTGTIRDDDAAASPPVVPPPEPPTEPPATAGLEGSYSLANAWDGGFQGSVAVQNNGPAAVSGWTLRLDMPFDITQIWNAEIVSRDADGYLIRNASWNGVLGDEQTASFGFLGTGTGRASEVDLVFG
ncbi:cellulase family glycosylhydrolase [Teichococcus oryzae]|uniref:cellulase n=1 Tax=Teichococcus oryzae TaxID=1608942 RepID=A0A5B2TJU2_9PROT|nr:cellulase family glycosylhydrolase [Pseudoroseomonas oryzae]KAA2214777.1 cellulase family glycosylhydrolase [Pseudoroseomonas oryzae]